VKTFGKAEPFRTSDGRAVEEIIEIKETDGRTVKEIIKFKEEILNI